MGSLICSTSPTVAATGGGGLSGDLTVGELCMVDTVHRPPKSPNAGGLGTVWVL
jgi:hypothetical protein